MNSRRIWSLATLAAVALPCASAQAGVRIGIGLPIFCGPYYGYPVYAAPPAVYAPPVVYQSVPVYQQSYAPPPAPATAPAPSPERIPAPTPAPTLASPPQAPAYTTSVAGHQEETEAALQQLSGGDDRGRAEAAVQLGRLRAGFAVDMLTRALEQDRSPTVREAAARGLGLIGAPSSLAALQRAAQADDDREVRHSAGFAAEVIRANLSR